MHDANPERVRAALSHLSPDTRKVWVRQAMAIKSEFGEDGFEIWDEWGSSGEGHNASSAKNVWKSIKTGKGVGLGSLFYDAKGAGWKDDTAHKKPTAAEIEQRKKLNAERAAQAEAEEAAQHEETAARAQQLWDAAAPCETHAYLERKGVKSYGLRYGYFEIDRIDEETGEVTVISLPALLVPIMDRQRKVWSLQAISAQPGGRKSLLKNGRKSGNFFVIGGKPLVLNGRLVFILVEGYATGASVHEATGHMVIMCIDAGNMIKVARALRERSPDAIILVAADNDTETAAAGKGNPGMEAAAAIAKECGALVACPPGGGDFNDLHVASGADAVVEVIEAAFAPPTEPAPAPETKPEPPTPDPAPAADAQSGQDHLKNDGAENFEDIDPSGHFVVLGYDGDTYWMFHDAKKQVVPRTRGDFGSDIGLAEMAPINWWEMYFMADGKKGIDRTRAFEWFSALAHARGIYDHRKVRGRGAWRDNGRIVFHHGDRLSVDGVATKIGSMKSRWVYPMSKSMPPMAAAPASDADGKYLLDVAKMARWNRPGSSALLAGWVFLSPVCGALSWRPHIWLTGAAGSGKTTIFESYAQALLDGISEPLAGDSTEPGIRQNVRADAIPILIDEFEPNEEADRKRMKGVLTCARQSSSETSAQTAKGTISGDGIRFHVRSMFCFSSINTMLDKDSDASRITPLVLRQPARSGSSDDQWQQLEEELHKIKRAGTWPGRLLARSLSMLPMILENVDVFCRAAAKHFGTQRTGDQYGTLLAGAWSLTNSKTATEAEALAMIASYDWSEHKDASDGMGDPQKALASVMESKIRVSNQDVTVYEMLAECAGQPVGAMALGVELCTDVLRRNGVRLMGAEVIFGTSSKSLRELIKDTPYSTDLRGQLRRLPGAHVHNNQTFKFAGVTSKVVALPVSMVLDNQDDEPPI